MAQGHTHTSEQLSTAQIEDYVARCMGVVKASGARVTGARRAVMRCLVGARQGLSPKDIMLAVQEDRSGPDIDQVTVYRILEAFSALGLVHQIAGGEYMACLHLQCRVAMHVLTRCSVCGGVQEMDIPSEMISPLVWYLDHQAKFTRTGHFFQIDGICRRCSQ